MARLAMNRLARRQAALAQLELERTERRPRARFVEEAPPAATVEPLDVDTVATAGLLAAGVGAFIGLLVAVFV